MSHSNLYKIIHSSVVSEKSISIGETSNQYVLRVSRDANKNQIKAAVEKLFDVEVDNVRTLIVKGKARRTRYGVGKKSDWKKVYLRLKEGFSIDSEVGG